MVHFWEEKCDILAKLSIFNEKKKLDGENCLKNDGVARQRHEIG